MRRRVAARRKKSGGSSSSDDRIARKDGDVEEQSQAGTKATRLEEAAGVALKAAQAHADSFRDLVDSLWHNKKYSFPDRDRLDRGINWAALAYDGALYRTAEGKRTPGDHLTPAIQALELEVNWPAIFDALASAGHKDPVARYNEMIHDLWIINGRIRKLPLPGRGRTSEAEDLRHLVEILADLWERETDSPFKQHWHKKEPISTPTIFVYEVVEALDRTRLSSLPTITKEVVAERRRKLRS
jgi:hypothetical protein